MKELLQRHLEESKGQVVRLEWVFKILNKRATGKTCEGMKSVLEEFLEAMEAAEPRAVQDAAIIAATQGSEHYEIAAYGTVVALAKALGQTEILQLLTETLKQEKAADKQLTIVSKVVNKQALSGTKSKDVMQEKVNKEK